MHYAYAPFPQPAPLRAGVPADGAPAAEPVAQLEPTPGINPWGVIWRVGGLCWLLVTCTALLWALPASGKVTGGVYVVTTYARLVQHVLVFLAAACAYRVALALGWPARAWPRARVLAINALLALLVAAWSYVAVALVAGFIDGEMQDMWDTLRALTEQHLDVWANPLRFFLPPYIMGLCAIALVMVADRHHREALRAAQLASDYAAARLAMLSAQLQPHFLFNSLHAVMGLMDESPRQASTMLARLGDFLRHALETSHSGWVDLATELAGLEAYLAVQRTRFAGRVSIDIEASPQSLEVAVPALLLQPLAENAIEHGRSEDGPPLSVQVVAAVVGERLCLVVSNSTPRLAADLTPAAYGRGLNNVELRLRAAYGADAHLTVGPDGQGGTSAILDLPVRRSQEPATQGQAVWL
jgi:two-component system, LytTR family, sensor kinase